jgi:nicotinamidase-related amidase
VDRFHVKCVAQNEGNLKQVSRLMQPTQKAARLISGVRRQEIESMNTALLIIDVQQSLVDEGIWDSERIIKRINQLIAKARNEQAPIILVRDTRVEPGGEFHRSIDRESHDIEIVKNFCNSFMETRLDDFLRNRNIGALVIGGIQTDFCVDTTCRHAAALGYDVILVSDAHSTLDHEHLKAEQIVAHHNRILSNFKSSKGRVRVLDTVKVQFR